MRAGLETSSNLVVSIVEAYINETTTVTICFALSGLFVFSMNKLILILNIKFWTEFTMTV